MYIINSRDGIRTEVKASYISLEEGFVVFKDKDNSVILCANLNDIHSIVSNDKKTHIKTLNN